MHTVLLKGTTMWAGCKTWSILGGEGERTAHLCVDISSCCRLVSLYLDLVMTCRVVVSGICCIVSLRCTTASCMIRAHFHNFFSSMIIDSAHLAAHEQTLESSTDVEQFIPGSFFPPPSGRVRSVSRAVNPVLVTWSYFVMFVSGLGSSLSYYVDARRIFLVTHVIALSTMGFGFSWKKTNKRARRDSTPPASRRMSFRAFV